ncbi:50S ribosomal protein L11 methyltransferase [Elongatibacter sediminis]|uniref:Ribosomal protein L11 methyltransferase n=1 Tax=Elongatibacter sediminis TaxID=3119006 RepID=A0AAW9R801_9GAMM
MPWAEISLTVDREHVPQAEELLENHGALAVTLLDPVDDPVLEPPVGETPLWPVVELRALFPEHADRDGVLDAVLGLPGVSRPDAAAWTRVEDQDWERAWLDRFRPMRFGENLWIVPTGMEVPADAGQVLRLDPGLAFGTGTHATTALCLDWIDSQAFAGCRVLDYGCGSGVLGIAAALKGAALVLGIDNDPQALAATADNAGRNGVCDRVRCQLPDPFEPDSFDFVLANILAAPLIDLAPRLGGCLAPGGKIVLSGILAAGQADAVAEAYAPYVEHIERAERDGWVRLTGIAPGRSGDGT